MINPEVNFNPTQESSIEDREKLLSDRILSIQLRYSERMSSGEIPFIDGSFKQMDFAQAASAYTWLPRRIRHDYAKRTGIELGGRELESYLDENEGEFANIFHEIMDNISKERELTTGANELAVRSEEIVTSIIERLPQAEVRGAKDERIGRDDVGSITYKVAKDMRGLEEHGISPDDLCADVHFEPMYTRKLSPENRKLGIADIEDSFGQLAKNIKEKHQDVKAVVGSSWLLDSQVVARLGFIGLEPYEGNGFSQGIGFWGQFIDAEGQIKQKEVDRFLETGKPKYRHMVGLIPIDEFLEKYREQ